MCKWEKQLQMIIDEIDACIKKKDDEALSLRHLSGRLGYSEAYGISPKEYRQNPRPVVLRTILKPFDCYLSENRVREMEKAAKDIKTYFVTIPAHKFLHIRNYESIGYWDFWQKQSLIPGQDCETICGLLDGIKDKLDDMGGSDANSGSGIHCFRAWTLRLRERKSECGREDRSGHEGL